MADLTSLRIDHAASILRRSGARGVDSYELKLKNNYRNSNQVVNHLSEARVALMFIDNGARVTMRDSPDLMIEWRGETFYAEVKHFRRKEQDEIDEEAMRNASGVLVGPLGLTEKLEDRKPYEQISDVARRKKGQYIDGAINILVIDSASESLDLMAKSGANEYSEEIRKAPHDTQLQRLHGIMIINIGGTVGGAPSNVDFGITQPGFRTMSFELARALESIRVG
jgi:hypothetical protein